MLFNNVVEVELAAGSIDLRLDPTRPGLDSDSEAWLVFCVSGFVQSRSVGLQTEEAEGVFGLRRVGRSGILRGPARHRRWAIDDTVPPHLTHLIPNLLPWQLITVIISSGKYLSWHPFAY